MTTNYATQTTTATRAIFTLVALVMIGINWFCWHIIHQLFWPSTMVSMTVYALLTLWYIYTMCRDHPAFYWWRPLLHWGGLLVLAYCIFVIEQEGAITTAGAGIFNLLATGFALFLEGLRTDSFLAWMGVIVVLFSTFFVAMTWLTWFIFIPIVIVVGFITRQRLQTNSDQD